MVGQFISLFGFFVTLAIIAGAAYVAYRVLHFFFGGAVFLVLFLLVVFFWVPAPLAPVLGPLQGLLHYLLDLCLTTALNGLNFVRNIGGR